MGALPTPVGESSGGATFRAIDTAEFTGDIPISSARMWGSEARAVLTDTGWLRQPLETRQKQMAQTLDRLAVRRGVSTLIIEDDAKRLRASAQRFGKAAKVQVRFY